jgi:hypothetical protein
MNNFRTDFEKLVGKYQRVYGLDIDISLRLEGNSKNDDPLVRDEIVWCDVNKKLKKEFEDK